MVSFQRGKIGFAHIVESFSSVEFLLQTVGLLEDFQLIEGSLYFFNVKSTTARNIKFFLLSAVETAFRAETAAPISSAVNDLFPLENIHGTSCDPTTIVVKGVSLNQLPS